MNIVNDRFQLSDAVASRAFTPAYDPVKEQSDWLSGAGVTHARQVQQDRNGLTTDDSMQLQIMQKNAKVSLLDDVFAPRVEGHLLMSTTTKTVKLNKKQKKKLHKRLKRR
jgi:hypothetical protein